MSYLVLECGPSSHPYINCLGNCKTLDEAVARAIKEMTNSGDIDKETTLDKINQFKNQLSFRQLVSPSGDNHYKIVDIPLGYF